MNRFVRSALGALVLVTALGVARDSDAFCGFYVGGADAKLLNDATVVVMMREGTRTVLAMQSSYKGPPEKFAMVVPVPVILQEENVKTLRRELFDHVDRLASPRLVEYWEQDPCGQEGALDVGFASKSHAEAPSPVAAAPTGTHGVAIEAQFAAGEYQIVMLSAKDSSGLEAWLHDEHYTIPEGAESYFRPYVASGSKFFVAKVDPQKVKTTEGVAELSPLRFHYDSDEFRLPVRLGLINSSGTQDLIVHILGRGTRYEVANYPNVTIPTNIDVAESARESFGQFYTTLFDRTLEKHPKAVVTEYAWEPTSCDACPGPALDMADLTTLGGDVLPSSQPPEPVPPVMAAPSQTSPTSTPLPAPAPRPAALPTRSPKTAPLAGCDPPYSIDADGMKRYKPECLGREIAPPPAPPSAPRPPANAPSAPAGPRPKPVFNAWAGGPMVLTRLHVRYTKDTLGEDLIFKAAPPIAGGREMTTNGALESGARPSTSNNFQARYAIRHAWTGPIDCKTPRRGVWGGKPGAGKSAPPSPSAATKLGSIPRTAKTDLASFVKQDIPEIDFARGKASSPSSSSASSDARSPGAPKSCLGCGVTDPADGRSSLALVGVGLALAALRRCR